MSEGVLSRGAAPRLTRLAVQVLKFGVVGGVGFVVDVALFNLLLLHPVAGIPAWPVAAKTVSTVAAIAVNWVGNRMWTFREHRRADTVREGVEFLIASLVGSGVSLVCLAFSHYVLQLTTTVDDNVSANVIGLILGSLVRFAAYRWWVFADTSPDEAVGSSTVAVAPSPGRSWSEAEPPASVASRATIASPSPPPE
ncbi:GtrA family protein [Microbacterium sp. NPDC057659]|uniref:GtrA family protein n=1 Tax=Microbacterium sp. NPDC057659 TaxID=3346198 RepID=UPI00366B502B